jgi:hypothetical protein
MSWNSKVEAKRINFYKFRRIRPACPNGVKWKFNADSGDDSSTESIDQHVVDDDDDDDDDDASCDSGKWCKYVSATFCSCSYIDMLAHSVLLLRLGDPSATQLPALIRNATLEAEKHGTPALQLVMHDRSNLADFFSKRHPCSPTKDALEDDLYDALKHDPKYAHHPKVVAHSPKLQGVSPMTYSTTSHKVGG